MVNASELTSVRIAGTHQASSKAIILRREHPRGQCSRLRIPLLFGKVLRRWIAELSLSTVIEEHFWTWGEAPQSVFYRNNK